ncbi:hypothetical protein NDU88_002187 [Pleurodeles waltl]|uniref:Uncharacterized protein n=1 Tax=Pleurodeles waltl TaxID=8319 RepID=A0AAV7P7L3_PLEWA|nr:hypothetical protein NDU88_002187 [Pleurodeles waltl]
MYLMGSFFGFAVTENLPTFDIQAKDLSNKLHVRHYAHHVSLRCLSPLFMTAASSEIGAFPDTLVSVA